MITGEKYLRLCIDTLSDDLEVISGPETKSTATQALVTSDHSTTP